MTRSEQLFERAVKRIPGGVNSPVRSYGAIGEAPRFIEKADKCYIYDVDGNRYVDYIDSWGPMILGHNFPEIRESVIKACENGLSFGCVFDFGELFNNMIHCPTPFLKIIYTFLIMHTYSTTLN